MKHTEERIFRMLVPKDVFVRYKMICVEREISVPKMTTELLKKFVEHDEIVKKSAKLLQEK
jgi:hypothetical protein